MASYAKQVASDDTRLIDLRDYPLPLCDAGSSPTPPHLEELKEILSSSKSIILAGPVYNYDLNAAAKNLIEWTGKAWMHKTVGFILAAGGKNAFMTPLSFMNSLMIDFRCIIVPRYVYADRSMFQNEEIAPSVQARIQELVSYTHQLGKTISTLHAELEI